MLFFYRHLRFFFFFFFFLFFPISIILNCKEKRTTARERGEEDLGKEQTKKQKNIKEGMQNRCKGKAGKQRSV